MKKSVLMSILGIFLSLACLNATSGFRLTLNPYLQNLTENEVTIIWETSAPSVGWVELAPEDGTNYYAAERARYYDSALGIKNISKVHKVTLTGLKKNTTYRYRVISHEVTSCTGDKVLYDDYAATVVYEREPLRFTTRGKVVEEFTFSVMNDVHQDSLLFDNLYNLGNGMAADFFIFNGDMVNSMGDEKNITDRFLAYAVQHFASEKEFKMVRGNHETRGFFARTYMDYFETPTGLPYYSFTYGNAFFIVLDTGEDKPDSDIEYYGTADYGRYREEEAAWLKNELKSEACVKARHRIALMHIPPVGKDSWYGDNEVRRLFLPLLNDADLDVLLCGHTHDYAYYKPGEAGNAFPVLVNDNEAALSIHVDENKVTIQIYGRDGKKTEKFTYKRK